MRLFSNRARPVHLGPHPVERLPRSPIPSAPPEAWHGRAFASSGGLERPEALPGLRSSVERYAALFSALRNGETADAQAAIPSDVQERSNNLKAQCSFVDADLAGIASIPDSAWAEGRRIHGHNLVLVVAIQWPRLPRAGDPGETWLHDARGAVAEMRAAEVAAVMAHYIRQLGFGAVGHAAGETDLDIPLLAILSGLAEVDAHGALSHPYLGSAYSCAAVSTEMELAPDQPLAPIGGGDRWRVRGLSWFFGWGGTRPGWSRLNGEHRPLHWGPYPMERIKRTESPTTLLTDKIPRVPKRAAFFARALAGDLGPKAQKERARFATKTPNVLAMVPLIRAMVPHQHGPVASDPTPDTDDPDWNADCVKAAAYFLGADMVGISKAPDFAWYSHDDDGSEITPNHRFAITMLIDQGHETMEGASGDDWISGAQSMRAYMRGSEIAGILAEHLRGLGHDARSQTNADSQVLQIPLILLAGLGEMSRIGELVLNPFVGPRFKSVVVTTNLPLTPDKPIDFGLQDFCEKCLKCARECPCHAIPFGPKVMFNGYETWKPDAEKCARYRVTNPKGSACGRCMKTCPYNLEGLLSERLVLWAAINLPFTRKWLAILDDKLGRGLRNKIKRWWWDLEIVDGRAVPPRLGTNERDLNFANILKPEDEKIAHYPADMNPSPDQQDPLPPDRKEGLRRAKEAETPEAALHRLRT